MTAPISDDLKPLCNKLVLQQPISAVEAWPLIERIAELAAERDELKAKGKRLSKPVSIEERVKFALDEGYQGYRECGVNALIASRVKEK